jgi:hypothetical protein
MSTDPVIEFGQQAFGTDAGLPPDATARLPIPDWLAGASDEVIVPAEVDDPIRIKGRVPSRRELPWIAEDRDRPCNHTLSQ